MPRLFIAIDMPQEVNDAIVLIQKKLKDKQLFKGSFIQPEKLHLTLKFLGDIDNEQILKIKENLGNIKFKSFEAELNCIGFFPEHIVRIIWLSIDADEIKILENQIEQSLSWLQKPESAFVSHITIARVKSVNNRNELINIIKEIKVPAIKFSINSFVLKQSELTSHGSIYTDLEKYYLI